MGTQEKEDTALKAVEEYISEELKAHTRYVSKNLLSLKKFDYLGKMY